MLLTVFHTVLIKWIEIYWDMIIQVDSNAWSKSNQSKASQQNP